MNTQQRFKIYLVLILLTGVGLALAVPVLAHAHASARGSRAAPSAAGDIIYVARSGDGSDGLSWTTAYTDLQASLSDAESGDEIWVATGVYTPGTTASDTFLLVEGVAVYGGFDPAGDADGFIDRDWQAYPTILSGDIGGDDTNTNGVVLTTTDIIGDNSYHVVMADGTSTPITGSTVLDGFTITAGQANGGAVPDNRGGGYYCDGSGSGSECSPSLRNVTFSGNYALYGGAMYNLGNNSGTSNPSLEDVTFSGNSAANNGGAMINNGNTGDSSPSLSYVTFTGNSADTHGGAIYNYGQNGISSPSLMHVTFSENHADYGGALANQGSLGASDPSLEDVIFSGNSADEDGGALFNRAANGTSSPSLSNVTFSGNSAEYGGAVYNDGDDGTSSPSLSNVTFAGNYADYGGAMYNTGQNGTSSPSLSNIILWGNTAVITGSQLYIYKASITITTSLVQGGLTGDGAYNEKSTITDGGGNFDADPDFLRDPDPGPDGDWDGVDDDYGDLHLGSSSPAIDSGTNSAISLPTDLDGNPRVVDGDGDGTATVDMGAYEYNCPAGSILYVDHTASGGGGSWLEAKPDLALGLNLAGICPQVSQVWVATGVYTPGTARSDSFDLVPGVAVYGGFDPAGGADDFNERDWGTYPTILSGDIAGDDITDARGVITTTDHIIGGNSYHVVTADGTSTPITGTTVLDGFTITAGQADGEYPNYSGGGFYCDGYGSGGECSPSLRDVTLSGNWADQRGGGIYNYHSSPSLSNVTFSGNSAQVGGGMSNVSSSPVLTDVTFIGNAAVYGGGGMANEGGSPQLSDVFFASNTAMDGGGIYNFNSSPQLSEVIFSSNTGIDGGGMYSELGNPILSGVIFSGNSADENGGGMYNGFEGNPVLINVTLSGNSAGNNGGGMCNFYSNPVVRNSILWNNQDSSGTGTISATVYNFESSYVTLTHSLAQGTGGSASWTSHSSFVDGGGNLDSDPKFIQDLDPSAAPTTAGNLRLQADSPAIDKGNNSFISGLSTDLDGNPRVVDGDLDGTATVDMGAYEFQTYTLTVSLAGSGSGTVTGDGISCVTGSIDAGCIKAFTDGTIVHLTASASTGSTFTGWSGACNHTNPDCTVAMVDIRSVTANFTLEQYPLSVSLAGTGGGTVSSTPPGIDCGTDCSNSYDYGSLVSLIAAADPDSIFKGWGGACTGIGDCQVTMTEALSVTAAFDAGFVYLPFIMR